LRYKEEAYISRLEKHHVYEPAVHCRGIETSAQYVIPVFQRHYVWDRESQWEALWEDLLGQTRVRLQGQVPKPHFCGAIVVDQKKQQAVNELPRYQVIDGQQRLTTFQVILAAIRDVCVAKSLSKQYKRILPYLVNQNFAEQKDPQSEQYKLRPTRFDSEFFKDVISYGDRAKLSNKYVAKTNRGRVVPPRIIGAYLFFYDQVMRSVTQREEIFGSETYEPEEIVDAIIDAFTGFFRSVIIMLDNSDDAQIIFETLNSRGTPLLASDLMRNYIFLRAEQNKENVDNLYNSYWSQFEDKFWTVEQKQGRITKPRLEFLMSNVLADKTASEIQLNKIYQEYLGWINLNSHSLSVEEELDDFGKLGAIYRTLVETQEHSILGGFARFLRVFDVTTIFPVLMALWTEGPQSEEERRGVLLDLESYIIRRLVCGRDAKNYTRFFLSLIKELRPKKFGASAFREFLAQQTSESSDWPGDDEFRNKWLVEPAYGQLSSSRIGYILQRIEKAQVSSFTEDITINSALSVEHIMPRRWFTEWPLSDGHLVSEEFAEDAKTKQQLGLHLDEPSAEAARRQIVLNTFGNLTLLTHPLNSSVSNGEFSEKRKAIIEQSALSLNRFFQNVDQWDTDAIVKRGEILFQTALKVWARLSESTVNRSLIFPDP
jgi:Protein of unknown function DUF262/Protein of unknown function (DUF1524)